MFIDLFNDEVNIYLIILFAGIEIQCDLDQYLNLQHEVCSSPLN